MMPDQTVTVNSGGGADFTTIQAAIDDSDVTDGFYKVEIQNNAAYDENLTLGGSTGTPTIANYLWLTASDAAYHGGTVGTGARVAPSGADHAIEITEDFARIEKMHVQTSSGSVSSSECVRIGDVDDILIDRCIFDAQARNRTTNDGDCIYHQDDNSAVTIYNCLAIDADRSGIQAFGSNSDFNLEFCTVYGCSVTETTGSQLGNIIIPRSSGNPTTEVFNTVSGNSIGGQDFDHLDGGTVSGSNNASTDTSAPGTTVQTNIVTADTWTDASNFDFTVKDTGSDLYENGLDRTASKPDSRVDATVDIAGTTRPATPSIGAYELAAAGPDRSITAAQDAFLPTQAATATVRNDVTATQDAFLATQSSAVTVRNDLTASQDGFLPTQAAALAVRAALSAVHTTETPTQSASLGLIAGVSANQTTQLPTQDASLSLVQGLIADQTAFLPTQTSALALLSQVQGTQTTGLPSQTAIAQVLATLTASQTVPLATQDATVATADTRTVTSDQDAFLATQAAALALQATLSADQSTLLPTQTASAQVRLALDANQDAFLATQTASAAVRLALSAAQTIGLATQDGSIVQGDVSVITGTQTAFLPTQAASFQALIQITGDQAAFLATQVAPLTVLAQISATQTAPGPATQTATLALLAKLSGVQTTPLPTQDATVEPVAPGVRGLNFAYLPTQQGIVAVRSDIIATQIIPKPTQTSSLQHVFFMTGDHTTQLPTQTGLIIQGQLPALGLEGLAPTRASLSGKSPTTTNLRGRAP